MYCFSEKELMNELVALPDVARIAFASAAATRQLNSYEWFARRNGLENPLRLREIINQLWDCLRHVSGDCTAWSQVLDEIMNMLPEESETSNIACALADDAVSSCAYAIRCLLKSEPQEAVWAARRAYEAVDQVVIKILGIQTGMPQAESIINSHALVQRELECQRYDLILLKEGKFNEVQERAFLNGHLNKDEEFVMSDD